MRRAIDAAEVALKLGHSVEWFYKHRKKLEDEHAFPKPVPGLAKRWDEPAIDAWFDRQTGEQASAPRIAGSSETEPVEFRLARRASELAGTHCVPRNEQGSGLRSL